MACQWLLPDDFYMKIEKLFSVKPVKVFVMDRISRGHIRLSTM
jgi:hypothetical protein